MSATEPRGCMAGFGLLEVEVDGFTLGSPYADALDGCDNVDFYVQAPGGGHAGLIWRQVRKHPFLAVCGCGGFDWGCWRVGTLYGIDGAVAARRLLAQVLPTLTMVMQA